MRKTRWEMNCLFKWAKKRKGGGSNTFPTGEKGTLGGRNEDPRGKRIEMYKNTEEGISW